MLNQIGKEILKTGEPWFTKHGALIYGIYILIASLVIASLVVPVLKTISTTYPLLKIYIIVSLSPLLLYLIAVLFWRSWLKVRFSKKLTIVIAYNLGAIDYKRYAKIYNRFTKELKNRINEYDLGLYVNVVVKQIDIEFGGNAAAEIKTKLGLRGSTLLIWGSVSERKGKKRFSTLFSYEFGYKKEKGEEKAKKEFGKLIDRGLSGGLFGLNKYQTRIEQDDFAENIIATSLFILGCVSASFRDSKKTELLLEKFKQIYANTGLMRKREMGSTLKIVNDILKGLYAFKVEEARISNDNKGLMNYVTKLYHLAPDNYQANTSLAYAYEVDGNRKMAIFYNEQAKRHIPIGSIHLHIFNDAYFAISDGGYKTAIKLYDSIPDNTDVDINSLQIFNNRLYRKTGNPAFLFIEGYVVFRWKNREDGEKILEEFLDKATSEHSDLINKAKLLK